MLAKLKLKDRILAGYAVPLAILVGLNALVFLGSQRLAKVLKDSALSQDSVELINRAQIGISRSERELQAYIIDGSDDFRQNYEIGFKNFRTSLEEAERIVTEPGQKERLQRITEYSQLLIDFNHKLVDLVKAGKRSEAIALFRTGQGIQLIRELENVTEEFTREQQRLFEETSQKAETANNFLNLAYGLASLAAIVIGIASAYVIASGIAKTLKEAADKVAVSSGLISSTVQQQERIVVEQAGSVSETSSTMDQLGFVSLQSAQQAEDSADGASRALALAESGTRTVEQTMATMANLKDRIEAIARQIVTLSEQTTQINKVSSLVSDLANQTNMLALNAAVEASRAGESGRGFKVVATEIRKLADASKKSAEKINTLINDIQAAMNSTVMVTDEGMKTADTSIQLARETVNAFVGVSEAIESVFSNSRDISQSAKQQAVAVQEVVAAINALNLGAQETTESIANVRSSTEELNAAARKLEAVV